MTLQPFQGPPATPAADEDRFRYYLRQIQRHPAYIGVRAKVRTIRRLIPDALRLATNRFRQLPSAVIVGAQKAGTTQLFSYLIRHPRCFGGYPKEVHYFTKYADRSIGWYRSRFPFASRIAKVNGITIEATPGYISLPSALHHMREVLPDARVILLLRDPVDRAFSQYQHEKRRHREPREFAEVVRCDMEQFKFAPQLGVERSADAPPFHGCVARGYYVLQIELMWQLYPREQVLVADSADLFDDTNAVCQRVFDFIGLDHFDIQPDKIYNRGYYREKIDPATAELLRDHYRPYDELLVKLVGRQFRWMDSTAARTLASPLTTAMRRAA
jgi:hypothetical protein